MPVKIQAKSVVFMCWFWSTDSPKSKDAEFVEEMLKILTTQ